MTQRQKNFLADIFFAYDIKLAYIFPLEFLFDSWEGRPEIRERLEDFNYEELERVFGRRLALMIDREDEDCSEYLAELGGVVMVIEIRPLDAKSIKLDEQGRFQSGGLAGYKMISLLHARNFDAALCKACAEARKLKIEKVKLARIMQGFEKI